jgi:hypothetical protein
MKTQTRFNKSDFKTSSLCSMAPHCVAVAHRDGVVAVQDTKNPQQAALNFTMAEWHVFVAGVKKGEFDY